MDDDMSGSKLYCICRTSDTEKFMIGCDYCDEWYHGDCISITEELAKTITKFYCLMCRDANPMLKIEYKDKDSKSTNKQSTVKKKKQVSRASKSLRLSDDDDEPFVVDDVDTYKPPIQRRGTTRSRRQNVITSVTKSSRKPHKRERDLVDIDNFSPRQCYGPGCVASARRGSKYCSDECGIKLATNRIVEILPQRLRSWQSTGSSAETFSHRELEGIRIEQEAAKKHLAELDVKQKELEAMIAEAKKLPPISEDEAEEMEGDELMTYCVTCGHEVASRTAMRHMERCFNKFESQTSFGSMYKTKVEGVFCEVFNPQQKTYCMRLRILCPEHTKEQRISDTEVCGFPLVNNCFEPTGTYCRLPKKKCMRHYFWEKLRRAQLDMEKVQKWLKLEELFEKEQKIRFTMANRGAVLGLLLHQTILHD